MPEEVAARADVRQVEADAIECADRFFILQDVFLVGEEFGKTHFDPLESGWELHAIGPRIEACGQVDDHVRALLDLGTDELVHQVGARDHAPAIVASKRHGVGDPLSTFACETPGERVAEDGIGPLGFSCAVYGDPTRCVRDVPDQWL